MQCIRGDCCHRDEHKDVLWYQESRQMLCGPGTAVDLGKEDLGCIH